MSEPLKSGEGRGCPHSGDPREISTTGKRRELPATIIRPTAQASRFESQFASLGEIAKRASKTCGGATMSDLIIIGVDIGTRGAIARLLIGVSGIALLGVDDMPS